MVLVHYHPLNFDIELLALFGRPRITTNLGDIEENPTNAPPVAPTQSLPVLVGYQVE